ncbi:homing endonuclease [Yersinia phage MHG19]|nr:homing endonuclease [Yersinia phage MHG19]
MNYTSIYEKLISRAKTREISTYTESHHIIPKCMGGSNDEYNLVRLTPEEHYLAHQLLIKIYPNNGKLVYAAKMMCVSTQYARRSNKSYGWIRRRYSELEKSKVVSKETKSKMSEAVANKPKVTCPHCGKTGLTGNMNRWHFDNCSKHPTSPKVHVMKQETKEKIKASVANVIHKITNCEFCGLEGKECVIKAHQNFCKSNPNRKIKQDKTDVCKHCGKVASVGNIRRWHNDNCKFKPD